MQKKENFENIFTKIKNKINELYGGEPKNCCGCSSTCDGSCGCDCDCHNSTLNTNNTCGCSPEHENYEKENNHQSDQQEILIKTGKDANGNNIYYDLSKDASLLASEIKNTFNSVGFENWNEVYNSFLNYLVNQGFDKKTSEYLLFKLLKNLYVKNDEYFKNFDDSSLFKIIKTEKESTTSEEETCESKNLDISRIKSLAGLKENTIGHVLSAKKKMNSDKEKKYNNKNDDVKLPTLSDLKGKKPEKDKRSKYTYFAGKYGDNPYAK